MRFFPTLILEHTPRRTMVTLYCAVVGDVGHPFAVHIDPDLSEKEQPEAEEKEDGEEEWLTKFDILQGVDETACKRQLHENEKLRDVGLDSGDLSEVSPAEASAGKGHVHVLAVAPENPPTHRERQLVVNGVELRVAKDALNPQALVDFWKAFQDDRTELKADADELFKCRELLYPNLPEDVVQHCYYRWGGIPRYVLDDALVDDQQEFLENAMVRVDLDWLLGVSRKLNVNDPQAHNLLHYHAGEDFSNDYVEFASGHVVQEVYQRLYRKDKSRLLEFLAVPDEDNALAVLRGQLLEQHANSGGTVRIRHVDDSSEGNVGYDEIYDIYVSEGGYDDGEGERGDNNVMSNDEDGSEYCCDSEAGRWGYY
ncbi:hypothetical protein P3T76_002598 [Phytophthora citrophthora]|uniref:Crinkler (CRN) family protein n=1 Tax=Phytophthora citrophthora TaxID=4793 RepID=A0AAD9GV94_9STRA|nr:hypothetical protein P3T76_002598 [Phytophthora citrophthora]